MDNVKVTGAVGANVGLAWLQNYSADIAVLLLMLQCLVAVVTVLYVGTKVWKIWKSGK